MKVFSDFGIVLRSVAITFFLFLAVYLPAFAIASGMRLAPDLMVPVVILVSLTIASLFVSLAIRRRWLTSTAFGLQWPTRNYLACALILATPLSALSVWALSYAAEPGPLRGLTLTPSQVFLCFAIGAPIQEEVIFRALLQSTMSKCLASSAKWVAASGIAASLAVAVLFGLIHLAVGPLTAFAALILGVLAGELRRRSGSLVPAILCHSIFNLGGVLLVMN